MTDRFELFSFSLFVIKPIYLIKEGCNTTSKHSLLKIKPGVTCECHIHQLRFNNELTLKSWASIAALPGIEQKCKFIVNLYTYIMDVFFLLMQ